MYLADKLIFLELQKTGGTHIRRLLKQYVGGAPEGKHNRMLEHRAGSFVIGSIRNPWDWYVSLWAFGAGGNGALRVRTTTGLDFNYYHQQLPLAMGTRWLSATQYARCVYHDMLKPVAHWRNTYGAPQTPEKFRYWLHLLLDGKHRFDIGEGFGFSPLSQHAGLLSYRYFRLFTLGDAVYHDARLRTPAGLAAFDQEFNITSGMIRTEALEEDFIRVLHVAGYTLNAEQLAALCNKEGGKTNVSERRAAAHYYDADTLALVAEREQYLISKYGYTPPALP
jgi:hypothetical protein